MDAIITLCHGYVVFGGFLFCVENHKNMIKMFSMTKNLVIGLYLIFSKVGRRTEHKKSNPNFKMKLHGFM